MMNIKSKVTIIFLLFNIILFINMFKKLKEPNLEATCNFNGDGPIAPEVLFECKKKNLNVFHQIVTKKLMEFLMFI